MKKMNLEQMENVNGGNVMDGACGALGFVDGGIAIRYLARRMLGSLVLPPGWGQTVLAGATVACAAYGILNR